MQHILILCIMLNCLFLIVFVVYFAKQRQIKYLTYEKTCIDEERYALLLEQTRDVVFEWNLQTNKIIVSKTFEKRFGYEVPTDNFSDSTFLSGIIFEDDIARVTQMLSSLVSQERFTFTEVRICDSDKKYHWCKISATAIRDRLGKTCRIIGLISDIEEHKMQIQQAEERANRDSLTTIYNKGATEVLINKYLENELSASIMLIIDVDNFKAINDTFGHKIGDLALTNIGKGLKSLFRTKDIVGRIGGDEFIVFLTDLPEHFAVQTKAKEIFNVVTNALSQTSIKIDVTCSIGAAAYPKDGVKYYELYEKADTALYFSKAHGKNKLSIYSSNMLSKSGLCACPPLHRPDADESPSFEEMRTMLEIELASNHFEVYLQPKIPLSQNLSVQAEALIRYQHPDIGLLSPDQFIPDLEDRHLIYLIDLFVLKYVAKQLSLWKLQYNIPTISLNFSRYTLLRNNIVIDMLKIIKPYGISPAMIEIEVTESVGDVDIPQFLNACNTIRAEGFELSLDDFGAKHSNVAILAALPFHAVKLDKSIIDHMLTNERNLIIAQEFLRTCNKLGAYSVAEGVETEDQLTTLKNLGCDFVQGYYFDKPLPVSDFESKYLKGDNY